MPIQAQLTAQEHEILVNTLQQLTNQKTMAGLIQTLVKCNAEERRCLFLKTQLQSEISLQMINKWYTRVSMVQYAGIGEHRIEILRQIEKVLPFYDEKTSLTTFVKQKLQWYQEKFNIHPGCFYGFIYNTCAKFKKAQNKLARVRLEARLLEQLEQRNNEVFTQTLAMSKALTDAQLSLNTSCIVETSSGTHERKQFHTQEFPDAFPLENSFNDIDFSF